MQFRLSEKVLRLNLIRRRKQISARARYQRNQKSGRASKFPTYKSTIHIKRSNASGARARYGRINIFFPFLPHPSLCSQWRKKSGTISLAFPSPRLRSTPIRRSSFPTFVHRNFVPDPFADSGNAIQTFTRRIIFNFPQFPVPHKKIVTRPSLVSLHVLAFLPFLSQK